MYWCRETESKQETERKTKTDLQNIWYFLQAVVQLFYPCVRNCSVSYGEKNFSNIGIWKLNLDILLVMTTFLVPYNRYRLLKLLILITLIWLLIWIWIIFISTKEALRSWLPCKGGILLRFQWSSREARTSSVCNGMRY